MSLSEEEANAKLERLQQQLTLNLQAIDKNFAECNQVLTSRLIPEIERYSEATHQIWNHCKIWLYFFKSMDREENQYQFSVVNGEDGTNRPAHDSLSDRMSRMSHDVTMSNITEVTGHNRLGQSRLRLQRNQSYGTASRAGGNNTLKSELLDTDSSTYSSKDTKSPPHLIPYAISPDVLQRTPIREAADMFATDQLRNAGASVSSDDDLNQYRYFQADVDSNKGKGKVDTAAEDIRPPSLTRQTSWGQSNVMEDDVSNRRLFEDFVDNRTKHQAQIENRLSYNSFGDMQSPSDRNYRYKRAPKSIRLANVRDSFVPRSITYTPSDDDGSRAQTPLYSSNISNEITSKPVNTSHHPSPFSNIPISQSNKPQHTPSKTPPSKMNDPPSQLQKSPFSLRDKNFDLSSMDSFSIGDTNGGHAGDPDVSKTPSATAEHNFVQRMQTLNSEASNSQRRTVTSEDNHNSEYDTTVPYEFSDPLRDISGTPKDESDTPRSTAEDRYARYQQREKRFSGSFSSADLTSMSSTTANMTMITGLTGQIPARFDLKYFPEKFRESPTSVQLTRIYQYFADRPGMMLTVENFLEHANHEYDSESVRLLINLLNRRKFLKRVGDKQRGAWTIRR